MRRVAEDRLRLLGRLARDVATELTLALAACCRTAESN